LLNTFGAFQSYYSTSLLSSSTPSDISWIGSIQAFLLLLIGVGTGPIYDAGYFRHLVLAGSSLVVIGMVTTSLCTSYWQFMLAQGIAIGLGAGCLFVPSVAIVSTYFSTKRSFATGVAASGSSLGTRHLAMSTTFPCSC
jgi:MFS family permease